MLVDMVSVMLRGTPLSTTTGTGAGTAKGISQCTASGNPGGTTCGAVCWFVFSRAGSCGSVPDSASER